MAAAAVVALLCWLLPDLAETRYHLCRGWLGPSNKPIDPNEYRSVPDGCGVQPTGTARPTAEKRTATNTWQLDIHGVNALKVHAMNAGRRHG